MSTYDNLGKRNIGKQFGRIANYITFVTERRDATGRVGRDLRRCSRTNNREKSDPETDLNFARPAHEGRFISVTPQRREVSEKFTIKHPHRASFAVPNPAASRASLLSHQQLRRVCVNKPERVTLCRMRTQAGRQPAITTELNRSNLHARDYLRNTSILSRVGSASLRRSRDPSNIRRKDRDTMKCRKIKAKRIRHEKERV